MLATPQAAPLLQRRWIAPACAVTGLASAGYLLAIVWAGSAQTWRALASIGGLAIALGTAACACSLLVRFLRWRLILGELGHRLPDGFSLRVYLAGIALSSTPGKVGETLRSALLLPRGVAVHRSLAAFFADRLSDVVAVAALGALAGLLVGQRQLALEVIALGVMLGSMALAGGLRRGLRWRPRHPSWLGYWLARGAAPAGAWGQLWTPARSARYTALAVVAFGLQAAVFWAYVHQAAPGMPLGRAIVIYCSSTLIGAASLLPGGLGAMDSALVLQLQAQGIALPVAVAAAVATRLSTLWFSWLVGFSALLSFAAVGSSGFDRLEK